MPYVAKIEGNGVVLYKIPGNSRDRKIDGWPFADKVSNAVVSDNTLVVNFTNSKVRTFNVSNGALTGTF